MLPSWRRPIRKVFSFNRFSALPHFWIVKVLLIHIKPLWWKWLLTRAVLFPYSSCFWNTFDMLLYRIWHIGLIKFVFELHRYVFLCLDEEINLGDRYIFHLDAIHIQSIWVGNIVSVVVTGTSCRQIFWICNPCHFQQIRHRIRTIMCSRNPIPMLYILTLSHIYLYLRWFLWIAFQKLVVIWHNRLSLKHIQLLINWFSMHPVITSRAFFFFLDLIRMSSLYNMFWIHWLCHWVFIKVVWVHKSLIGFALEIIISGLSYWDAYWLVG